ncbi:MAG: hypothetical protein ACR2PK_06525 [Acidimicrobiales bacterium]
MPIEDVIVVDVVAPSEEFVTAVEDGRGLGDSSVRCHWLDASRLNDVELEVALDRYLPGCRGVLVSCIPTAQATYVNWALDRRVPALVDKPLFTSQGASVRLPEARLVSERLRRCLAVADRHQIFWCPLRYRGTSLFKEATQTANLIYETFGAQLNHFYLVSAGGITRYPAENSQGGAHSHAHGIGSLGHSLYHMIDLFAWFLGQASEENRTVEVALVDVVRLKDYAKGTAYEATARANGETSLSSLAATDELRPESLETEVDFSFSLIMRDAAGDRDGSAGMFCAQSSFAPRSSAFVVEHDHANTPSGGRMTSFVIDIHQEGLANLRFEANQSGYDRPRRVRHSANFHPRLHSAGFQDRPLAGTELEEGAENIVFDFCAAAFGRSVSRPGVGLLDQRLTIEIYGAMLESIAGNLTGEEPQNRRIPVGRSG